MKNVLSGLLAQKQKPVDDVPAMLTQNEYVIPADVVVLAGHGNPKAGAVFFSKMVDNMRRKATKKIKKHLKGKV